MIQDVELMKIEGHFSFGNKGLIVVPPVDLPENIQRFKSFSTTVLIKRPDSSELSSSIRFELDHVCLIGGDCKWAIAVILPEATKKAVPIGSNLFISEMDKQRLKCKK